MSNPPKLNSSQKMAVLYLDGPLLIVAGAGTGKTTVITSKIAHILEKNLAKPEEILALTFNEKAAAEVLERVDETLGLNYADIQISTFHAFCQRVLEQHALDIGLSNQFKILTPTAAWLLVQRNFKSFDLDYYRPIGNPYRHINALIDHFGKCKDELISPEDYSQYAKNAALDDEEERKRLLEISNAFAVYNRLLQDNNVFDFGDLIYYTHELFCRRGNVLKKFQKKFKYILVDEFQDVNFAQYSLVKMLSSGGSQLTAVGDDDQSIYAFRGASVSNILHFKEDFPDVKEIVLNQNYRSLQSILDLAYKSIQNNNPDRLEVKLNLDKKLLSARKEMTGKQAVAHLHLASLSDEVEGVVNEIARLKKINKEASWGDFAILVRANGHAEPFVKRLQAAGIPYEFLASAGLFKQPIIIDVVSFMKLLVDYRDSLSLYRLLCLKFLGFRISDLHALTSTAKRLSVSYYSVLRNPDGSGISEEGLKICSKLHAALEKGLQGSISKKPYSLVVDFLQDIGYFKYLVQNEEKGDGDSIRLLSHLREFMEFIKEFEQINPDAKVFDFLNYFNLVSEAGDKGSLYEPSEKVNSVNILTVHNAKGLEFKYVFVVNLVEDRFPSRNRSSGIEFPEELIKKRLPEGDSHIEEERRLFYVAVTRAKDCLYLTSASDYGGERAKKISRFLAELGYAGHSEVKEKKILIENEERRKEEAAVFELPKVFSFSQIQTYEKCPFQYKLGHILKLPSRGSAATSFGSTIHNTLQSFYNRMKEVNSAAQISIFEPKKSNTATLVSIKTKIPTLDELLQIYQEKWISEWYDSEDQRNEYFDKGKKILTEFYHSQEDNWVIPEELEKSFRIRIGEYYLRGKIDRIDKLPDGTLEIIDYKTGKPKETLKAEDKDQLILYEIAVEQVPELKNLGKPGKLTYYYLDENLQVPFVANEKDRGKFKQKVIEVIGKINNREFDPTPSQFKCEYCEFKNICEYRI